jgi:aspartate/methionine/tyrosine aminotransferase
MREAVARKEKRVNNIDITPKEVLVTRASQKVSS